METIADFEDLLALLEEHGARYLIVGGLAFIYHAKPRYTKDMDVWVDPDPGNIERVNRALEAFPSPELLTAGRPEEILQIARSTTLAIRKMHSCCARSSDCVSMARRSPSSYDQTLARVTPVVPDTTSVTIVLPSQRKRQWPPLAQLTVRSARSTSR